VSDLIFPIVLFLFSASLPASAMVSPREKKIETEREQLLRNRSASFENIYAHRARERERVL
jgi:hypothetical protein